MPEVSDSIDVDAVVRSRGPQFTRLHILGLMQGMTSEERVLIMEEFCYRCGDRDGPMCGACAPDPIDD